MEIVKSGGKHVIGYNIGNRWFKYVSDVKCGFVDEMVEGSCVKFNTKVRECFVGG